MLKGILFIISIPLFLLCQDLKSQDTLTIFIPDYEVTNESNIILPVQFLHFDSIVNFQFSLAWDSAVLDFVGITNFNLEGLSESSFNILPETVNSRKLGCFWVDNTTLGLSIDDSTKIFDISFDVLRDDKDSTKIIFTNDPTDIEAGNVYESVIPFKTDSSTVTFDINPLSTEATSRRTFELLQNSPNPFAENTIIPFELRKPTIVLFEVFDVVGKRIFQKKSLFPKGMNNIELNKLQLTGPGVYEYSLTAEQKTKTKKLVLLN